MKRTIFIGIMNVVKHQDYAQLKGIKFLSAMANNARVAEEQLKDINSEKPPKGWDDYQKEFRELSHKYALRDKAGDPVVTSNGYALEPKTENEFYELRDALEEKYKDIIEEFKIKDQERAEFLEGDLDADVLVRLRRIKESDLPADITAALFDPIYDLIDFEPEESSK